MSSIPAPSVTGSLPVTRSRSKIQLAFTVIYVVWGVTYAVNRIMALALPPFLAAGARFVLAGIFPAVVARWRGLRMPGNLRDWRFVAAAAIPIVAVFTGWLLLDERLDALQLIGSLIVFAGVIVVRKLRLWPRRRGKRSPRRRSRLPDN